MILTSDKKNIFSFTVSADLLDSYGHVNNARYLELYENARWDILEKSGLGKKFLDESKIGLVILEVSVRFSREITEGQLITIETGSRRKGDRLFYFDQVMKNPAGEICSQAVFTTSLFNLNQRKMVRADRAWLSAFGF